MDLAAKNRHARNMAALNKDVEAVWSGAGGTGGRLLAVDAGVRTGLALFGRDGRLLWCRSKNFGTLPRLKRGAATILRDILGLERLVVEGFGTQAEPWRREAGRLGLACSLVSAETWRRELLLARQQTSGSQAKLHAEHLARRVIGRSGLPQPKSLRHDAAEAVCLGLWAVTRLDRAKTVQP